MNDLPKWIQKELFKLHTHAELVDPEAIVYTEEDVIRIIQLIIDKRNND